MSGSTSRRAAAPDWRRTLFAVCVAQATAIVGFDFTLPFIPLYLQHDLGVHGLGATALWAGLIGFGPAIPATIMGPVWGKLADRWGYRFMLLRAMLSAAMLLALMGLAPNPFILLVLRMFQGGLTGTVYSAQALVASSAPEDETGRAMGLLQMSVYLGATFGPVGGGMTAQALGYRATFIAAGIMLALATVVVYFFVHESERATARRMVDTAKPSILSVVMIPAFAAALALTLVVQLAGTALLPVVPLFVQDLLGTSHGVATATGWLMAASGVAGAVGSFAAGRIQRYVPLRVLMMVSIALSAGLLAPQAFVGSFAGFLVLRCLAACAFGSLFSLVGIWAAHTSPNDAKGTAFGLLGAASSVGFGSGPLLGGMIAASAGIRPVFLLSAAILAIIPAAFAASFAYRPAIRARRALRTAQQ